MEGSGRERLAGKVRRECCGEVPAGNRHTHTHRGAHTARSEAIERAEEGSNAGWDGRHSFISEGCRRGREGTWAGPKILG